jgi:pyruvate-formate lyase-activating enzyme
MSDNNIFVETKEKLNKVGCGFCLAKWTQVTMHLHNGMTHSCHHPSPHKIPMIELETNPTALHNTNYKKNVRKEMLTNKKPQECGYCWNIENNSKSYSDRVFKSAEEWSSKNFDEITSLRWDANYNPKYVEVSFSNTCNFKCSYCGPTFSSKWVEEIEKHGGYPTTNNFNNLDWLKNTDQVPYKHSEHNPYVEAFWKWWPELYNDLDTFRITGGEPLLSKDTWAVLEHIATTDNPNRNLNLSINSNLGVPKNLIERFINLSEKIINEGRVKTLIVFTSCDTYGEQAEYARHGMNFGEFIENIELILSRLPKVTVNIMCAFNVFSPFGYEKLIDKVFELKKKYHNKERYWISAVQLDTSYIRYPQHLTVKVLEKEHKELILKAAKKSYYYAMREFTHEHYGFSDTEVQKIKRLYDYSIGFDYSVDEQQNKIDFVKFVDEHDKRRGTNFIETFPELEKMYNNVKNR